MDVDDAMERSVPAQRHGEPGSDIPQLQPFSRPRIVAEGVGLPNIGDVSDAFAARDLIVEPARPVRVARAELPQPLEHLRLTARRDKVEQLAVEGTNPRFIGPP